MQPIRITLPADSTLPGVRQYFVCEGFAVDFRTARIIPALALEQFSRTETAQPLLDALGNPTGETQPVYGEWEPYRRFYASGRTAIQTESNNIKQVDPATFQVADERTTNPVGEVDAIWSQFGPSIEGLLRILMGRMIQRGNLLDISEL